MREGQISSVSNSPRKQVSAIVIWRMRSIVVRLKV